MKTTIAVTLTACALILACSSKTTPPVPQSPLTIISPANGAHLGDPTVIEARPGPGYQFTYVAFFVDSAQVGTDSLAPYRYLWNVYDYPSGSNHTISATGYTAGPSYSSAAIIVHVEYTLGFSSVATYHPNFQRAVGVTTYQTLMFISAEDAGLEVIDVSDIFSPTFLSRFDTPGQALHAFVAPLSILIADGDQGVERADFSNPDTLTGSGHYTSGSIAHDVAVSGNVAFVAENGGLSLVSLTDPDSLIAIGRLGIQDVLYAVAARADTAFAVGADKFYVVVHSRPIHIVGTYGNSLGGKDVAVVDTFAFVADTPDGVLALSISDPANPRFLARFNAGQLMTTVAVGEGTLFAGAENHFVYALDYSTPDTLMLLDQFDGGDLTKEVHFQWPYLFVAATNSAYILRFIR